MCLSLINLTYGLLVYNVPAENHAPSWTSLSSTFTISLPVVLPGDIGARDKVKTLTMADIAITNDQPTLTRTDSKHSAAESVSKFQNSTSSETEQVVTAVPRPRPPIDYSSPSALARSTWNRFKSVWTRRFTLSVLAGQVVSFCITSTNVTTTELVERNWSLPTTQSWFL